MNFIGKVFFNFIGASIRWIFGTIWRTLHNKDQFTFNEYLYGSKNNSNYYDEMGHQFNNKMIGGIFFFLLILILQKIF